MSVRHDNAGIRRLYSCEAFKQGRFTGAIGPDEPKYFAAANGKMDVVKRSNESIRFGKSADGEKYICGHGPEIITILVF